MDYNGRIYQLVCEDGYYYIGSTKNELRKRLHQHKMKSKEKPNRRLYQHVNMLGWDKVKIVLVEEIMFKTKDELVKREYEIIQQKRSDKYCLNTYIGNYDDSEYKRLYRKQNAIDIKLKRAEKTTCECGSAVSKPHISRHKTSTKHIQLLNNKS